MQNKTVTAAALLLSMFVPPSRGSEAYEFEARHHHLLKDCVGSLTFSEGGVEYRTSHQEDSRKWSFQDIRVLEIPSPTEVSIVSYEDQRRFFGKDRVFSFSLAKGRITAEQSAFLLAQVKRPMLLAVLPELGVPRYEVRAKHLRRFGGSVGVLQVYSDRLVFRSAEAGRSRIWRISDIERIGQADRFRFQISTSVERWGGPTEVYNFQLLEDLPSGLYDYLWLTRFEQSIPVRGIGPTTTR